MKSLIFIWLFFPFGNAFAQFSVLDSDGNNKFKILGKEWNTNFFSLASIETDKFTGSGGKIATYNHLTFATYTPGGYRIVVRTPFSYNSAGTDRFNGDRVQNPEFLIQDLILGLQNFNLLYLPLDFSVFWEGRIYLPTSQNSKDSGLISRIRNTLIFNRVFSRHFEMELDHKFSYFLQSRTVYRAQFEDELGFPQDAIVATKRMEIENNLRLWGKVTAQTGLGWMFGQSSTFRNQSAQLGRTIPPLRELSMGPQFRFPVFDSYNIILSYTDNVNVDQSRSELGRFLAKNTQWTLLSFVRF